MICIGTSGYGYHDWTSSFYPQEIPHEDYLRFYAKRFSACELSFTCYRMPGKEELERLAEQSERRVTFTVKAHRQMTHQRGTDLLFARRFARSLDPLYETGRLGAVLAQFPQAFLNNPGYRAYLCRLRAALDRVPLVVELRHPSWFNDETLDFLRGWGIGLASVDGPDLPYLPAPQALLTCDIGYVRFHGRNAARWWQREEPSAHLPAGVPPPPRRGTTDGTSASLAEAGGPQRLVQGATSRYDYDYSPKELLGWLPRLQTMEKKARSVFVIFTNHWHGKAAANALALQQLVNQSRARSAARRRARPRPRPAGSEVVLEPRSAVRAYS